MLGNIQSILSFSTVDGPGTRCVVFFQGCPVGCIFCHNPDSWDSRGGEAVEPEEILRRLERYRPFLSNPGVTFSGGEPMMQPDFLRYLAALCRAEGWHTALDTSGWGPAERLAEAASVVDLVMISVKDPLGLHNLCRLEPDAAMANIRSLKHVDVPVWLRYVLISGLTDDSKSLRELGRLAAELPNLQRLEILPYNSLAANKWAQLGRDFPLSRLEPGVGEDQLRRDEDAVWQAFRELRPDVPVPMGHAGE